MEDETEKIEFFNELNKTENIKKHLNLNDVNNLKKLYLTYSKEINIKNDKEITSIIDKLNYVNLFFNLILSEKEKPKDRFSYKYQNKINTTFIKIDEKNMVSDSIKLLKKNKGVYLDVIGIDLKLINKNKLIKKSDKSIFNYLNGLNINYKIWSGIHNLYDKLSKKYFLADKINIDDNILLEIKAKKMNDNSMILFKDKSHMIKIIDNLIKYINNIIELYIINYISIFKEKKEYNLKENLYDLYDSNNEYELISKLYPKGEEKLKDKLYSNDNINYIKKNINLKKNNKKIKNQIEYYYINKKIDNFYNINEIGLVELYNLLILDNKNLKNKKVVIEINKKIKKKQIEWDIQKKNIDKLHELSIKNNLARELNLKKVDGKKASISKNKLLNYIPYNENKDKYLLLEEKEKKIIDIKYKKIKKELDIINKIKKENVDKLSEIAKELNKNLINNNEFITIKNIKNIKKLYEYLINEANIKNTEFETYKEYIKDKNNSYLICPHVLYLGKKIIKKVDKDLVSNIDNSLNKEKKIYLDDIKNDVVYHFHSSSNLTNKNILNNIYCKYCGELISYEKAEYSDKYTLDKSKIFKINDKIYLLIKRNLLYIYNKNFILKNNVQLNDIFSNIINIIKNDIDEIYNIEKIENSPVLNKNLKENIFNTALNDINKNEKLNIIINIYLLSVLIIFILKYNFFIFKDLIKINIKTGNLKEKNKYLKLFLNKAYKIIENEIYIKKYNNKYDKSFIKKHIYISFNKYYKKIMGENNIIDDKKKLIINKYVNVLSNIYSNTIYKFIYNFNKFIKVLEYNISSKLGLSNKEKKVQLLEYKDDFGNVNKYLNIDIDNYIERLDKLLKRTIKEKKDNKISIFDKISIPKILNESKITISTKIYYEIYNMIYDALIYFIKNRLYLKTADSKLKDIYYNKLKELEKKEDILIENNKKLNYLLPKLFIKQNLSNYTKLNKQFKFKYNPLKKILILKKLNEKKIININLNNIKEKNVNLEYKNYINTITKDNKKKLNNILKNINDNKKNALVNYKKYEKYHINYINIDKLLKKYKTIDKSFFYNLGLSNLIYYKNLLKSDKLDYNKITEDNRYIRSVKLNNYIIFIITSYNNIQNTQYFNLLNENIKNKLNKKIDLMKIKKIDLNNMFYEKNEYYSKLYKNNLLTYNNFLLNELSMILYKIFNINNDNNILINFYYNWFLYNEKTYTKMDNIYAMLKEYEYASETITNTALDNNNIDNPNDLNDILKEKEEDNEDEFNELEDENAIDLDLIDEDNIVANF